MSSPESIRPCIALCRRTRRQREWRGYLAAQSRDETALTLDSQWSVFILNGYATAEQTRRRPADPAIGTYRAACLLAPRIHNHVIELADSDQTFARVEAIRESMELASSISGVSRCSRSA